MIRSVNGTYRDRSQLLIIFPADPRFSNIQTDPRFRLPSKKTTHVQIDQRFAHMLRDEEFSTRAKVDRYGRKLSKDAGKRELQKFYRIGDENIEGEDGEADDADDDDEVELELRRANARDAEIASSSSEDSFSDEDDSEDLEEEEEIFKFPDELVEDGGVPMGEPSRRLAVVNLDWDNIRAVDLMAVFSSFTPGNGRISKISIYPSEFGKARMAREEMEGPPKEIFAQRKPETKDDDGAPGSESDEDESVDGEDDEEIKKSLIREDEGEEFDSAKLRRYQLERLRYHYAVITCSSTPVAEAIYKAVDGTEYLTTANFFDLRFIPDELDFSDDKARDECDDIPDGYRPNEFVTDALQHSKVKLTWDADDRSRKEAQKKAFAGSRADIDENDLKAYLGSDSSEDEAPEPVIVDATTTDSVAKHDAEEPIPKLSKKEAERQRMRVLLGLPTEPVVSKKSKKAGSTPVGDVQVTFSSAFTLEKEKGSVFMNEPPHEETTVEKYIRKEKERKKNRKEKTVDSREAHSNIDQAEVEKTSADAEDLGFDDPFFESPSSKAATKPKSKKSPKTAKDAQNSTSLAELELLMIPEKSANKDAIKHFDMQEIALAEKALRKAKKSKGKSKLSKREKSALEAMKREGGDGFEVDVQDPRFGAVFERSEFAIDPSHPKFKGTEGMRKILEEGRKKRRRDEVDEVDGEGEVRKKNKADEITGRKAERGNEVAELVAKVKRKAVKS